MTVDRLHPAHVASHAGIARMAAPFAASLLLAATGCPANSPARATDEGDTERPTTEGPIADTSTPDACRSSADCAGACVVVPCPAADAGACGHRECTAECLDAFTQNMAEQACIDDAGCCGGETCSGGGCVHGHPGDDDGVPTTDGTTTHGTTTHGTTTHGTTTDGTTTDGTTTDGTTTDETTTQGDGVTSRARDDDTATTGSTSTETDG